jgi:hypothetical protein
MSSESWVMADWKKSDYDKVIKSLESIAGRMVIRKAIERAALRAAKAGEKASIRRIAEETTLSKSIIAKKMKVYKYGTELGMAIGLKISDTARPLSDFAFTPKKPVFRTAPTVEIYKGQKKLFNEGAFVAPVKAMDKKHMRIFERKGEKHFPIQSLPGPSVTGLFKASEERENHQVWEDIFNKFKERVMHEVEFLLTGKSYGSN